MWIQLQSFEVNHSKKTSNIPRQLSEFSFEHSLRQKIPKKSLKFYLPQLESIPNTFLIQIRTYLILIKGQGIAFIAKKKSPLVAFYFVCLVLLLYMVLLM